jgi:uncharacterized cofD-like protein
VTSAEQRARVVAIGGGRGLSSTVAALQRLPVDVTAVVSVADDGSSSGVLRDELGVLPPGDFRKVLVAMASDHPQARATAELFERRFGGDGSLAGHAVGNLVLAGLFESAPNPIEALRQAGDMLASRGTVLPAAEVPMDLIARVRGGDGSAGMVTEVRGQAELVQTSGQILELRVEPHVPACDAALTAVDAADIVVLGPGSWFTSVLPPLLLPDLAAAVAAAPAVVLVLNLESGPGETAGMSAADHLAAFVAHVPSIRPSALLVDPATAMPGGAAPDLASGAESLLGHVVVAPVASPRHPGRHDPDRLATAFRALLAELVGPDWEPSPGGTSIDTVSIDGVSIDGVSNDGDSSERMAATRWL